MTSDPLKNILFISLPEEWIKQHKDFPLDPKIAVPIEVVDIENWSLEQLRPEMITSALLKIMAYHPEHKDIESYRRLIYYINPNIEEELTKIAIIKTDQKDYQLAGELFSSLRGLDPQNNMHQLNLCLLWENMFHHYEKIGKKHQGLINLEKAHKGYEQLLRENPPVEAYYHGGAFFLRRGEISKAIPLLRDYVELGTDSIKKRKAADLISEYQDMGEIESLFQKALNSIREENLQEAGDLIDQLLQADSGEWKHWYLKGLNLRLQKLYADAKEALGHALEMKSQEPEIYNELALCFLATEEPEECRNALELGLRCDGRNIKILSNLAILSLKEDRLAEAKSLFQQILNIDPEDLMAIEYLSRLDEI